MDPVHGDRFVSHFGNRLRSFRAPRDKPPVSILFIPKAENLFQRAVFSVSHYLWGAAFFMDTSLLNLAALRQKGQMDNGGLLRFTRSFSFKRAV